MESETNPSFSAKTSIPPMAHVNKKGKTLHAQNASIGCRIAERTQIQVPGLNGRVEEPVKSQKTT